MARAHSKGITGALEGFLRVSQPEWYKLNQTEQHETIRKAFIEERAISASIRS